LQKTAVPTEKRKPSNDRGQQKTSGIKTQVCMQKTRGHEGGVKGMEVILKGEPKEIAALVVELQERRELIINPDRLAKAICGTDPKAQ